MSLLLLIALPCVAAVVGQALRGIRILTAAFSILALVAELVILRGIKPEDGFAFGTITLTVSPLAALLLSLFIFLTGAIVLYNYSARGEGLTAAALFMLGGVAAVLLLNNFLLITFIIEMVGVSIVFFSRQRRQSRAGVGALARYLAAAVLAFVCLVLGFLIIDMYRLSAENAILARLVLALILIGFGIRLAGFPFHFWLPDFSENSPPMATALLVSVLSLAVIAFLIVVFSTFPWILGQEEGRTLLLVGGIAGALAGAILALGQSSLNRVLAYSAISDLGLIIFGLGTVSNLGLAGAIFESITLAVGKLLLLMCAGTVARCCGEISLAKLGGLAPKLPVTTIGFIVGGLSIAGYPPFGGFASRWVLLNVAEQNQGFLAVWILLVSGLLLLAFARVFREAFLGEAVTRRVSREPFVPALLILGLSLAILAIGLYPAPLFNHIQAALTGISFSHVG